MSGKDNSLSSIARWRPDFRYCDDKFVDAPLELFKSHDPSVTDKEVYRLTLASLRGELAQGSGRPDVGSYSLKAGEEYNPDLDFSFLNRKDLTIVQLDEFIKDTRERLEKYDIALTSEIETQLAKAEKKRQQLEKETVDKNADVSK